MHQLARTDDMSKEACAFRLSAALAVTGLSKSEIAQRIGRRASSITNQTKGDQFPSREIMAFLYEYYDIDFNFILAGSYGRVPADVLDKLFPILAAES